MSSDTDSGNCSDVSMVKHYSALETEEEEEDMETLVVAGHLHQQKKKQKTRGKKKAPHTPEPAQDPTEVW